MKPLKTRRKRLHVRFSNLRSFLAVSDSEKRLYGRFSDFLFDLAASGTPKADARAFRASGTPEADAGSFLTLRGDRNDFGRFSGASRDGIARTRLRKRFREPQFASFFWQAGFGAFSVSQSQIEDVRAHIRNQREHHRVRSFQEEFRAFLRTYEVEFDERYVWD